MDAFLATFQSPGPVLIRIGSFSLRWYGLLIAFSVIIGLNISRKLAKLKGLDDELLNDLLPGLIVASIIGARAYYVAFEWKQYSAENFWGNLNFFELNIPIPRALEIWGGGIAIHGALIAGSLAIILFCRQRKQSFWELMDLIVPSVALGQAIGRWGNFFNQEAFGIPTNLPWKLFIPKIDPDSFTILRPNMYINNQFFHPTFLYESIWDLILFIILLGLFKQGLRNKVKIPSGSISCIYIFGYSLGRVWIESLRVDPLCLFSSQPLCAGGFRIAQIISMFLMGLGALGIWWLFARKRRLPEPLRYKSEAE
ncbi:prolipoprotein diacylglyceryl transferase [Prochlorococcus sp. MIT 1300]|uniref:prolipoprotein diacylglyceryl transferase n=1 Tax=Prochlorococcus sp. MIT 1300 TaxID=3096218 RepID=UPI002A75812B|nr:prolipoprotein diacylglyceryl transferase [Prochlorococcus sp. MIT 1300]